MVGGSSSQRLNSNSIELNFESNVPPVRCLVQASHKNKFEDHCNRARPNVGKRASWS